LKKDSFQNIVPSNANLAFVDSGSGEIVRGANLSVSFLRLYAGIHSKKMERLLQEYILVVVAVKDGLDLAFDTSLLDLNGKLVDSWRFGAFEPWLCFGGRRAEPSAVVGYVRKLLEFRLCLSLCSNLSAGDVIVRDGDLEADGDLLKSARLSLSNSAQKKGVIIVGLSKTSTLCTDSGNSAIHSLLQIAPSGSWSFYSGSSVAFVKLHPFSKYIFRCDVFSHDRDSLSKIWGALASNSGDPAFLGYPYGLVDADRFAQVPQLETSQLRARFEAQSRGIFSAIERAVDAHDILNSFY